MDTFSWNCFVRSWVVNCIFWTALQICFVASMPISTLLVRNIPPPTHYVQKHSSPDGKRWKRESNNSYPATVLVMNAWSWPSTLLIPPSFKSTFRVSDLVTLWSPQQQLLPTCKFSGKYALLTKRELIGPLAKLQKATFSFFRFSWNFVLKFSLKAAEKRNIC